MRAASGRDSSQDIHNFSKNKAILPPGHVKLFRKMQLKEEFEFVDPTFPHSSV